MRRRSASSEPLLTGDGLVKSNHLMSVRHEVFRIFLGDKVRSLGLVHDEINDLVCGVMLGGGLFWSPHSPISRGDARGFENALIIPA